MPKLPTFMKKRGRFFYFRMREGKKDKWISLGSDFRQAVDAHRELVYRYSRFRNQRKLERKLEDTSTPIVKAGVTVTQLAEKWLKEYVPARRNLKDQKLAFQRYRDHIEPVIGHMKLAQVAPSDLRHLKVELGKRGLALNSVRHVLSDFRCMLNFAEKELCWLEKAPIPPRFLPNRPEEAPDRLTDEELGRLFGACAPGHVLVLRLALETGLRWGELKALKWRHFQAGEFGRFLVLEGTKSGKVRRLFMSDHLGAELEKMLPSDLQSPIFPGLPKEGSSLVRRLTRRCGVRWHFHQLRHTFACRWLEAGGSKEALREMLGHSTIKMTEHYGKVSDHFVAEEACRVANRVAKRVAAGDTTQSQVTSISNGTSCQSTGIEVALSEAPVAQIG